MHCHGHSFSFPFVYVWPQRALSHWNMNNWSKENKTDFGAKVRIACSACTMHTVPKLPSGNAWGSWPSLQLGKGLCPYLFSARAQRFASRHKNACFPDL